MNPRTLNTISGSMTHNLKRNDLSYNAFSGLYNITLGPYNQLTVAAVHEAYDAIEETPMFVREAKYALNKAEKLIATYESLLHEAYVTKYNLYMDYCNRFAAMVEPDMQKLRNAILLTIGRLGVRGYEQHKASLLLAVHLCDNASELHNAYMTKCLAAGANRAFVAAFDYADMAPAGKWLQRAAGILIRMDDAKTDMYNHSEAIKNGLDILNMHLLDKYGNIDFRKLGDLAADALDLNRETYGDEADKARAELRRIDMEKEKAIEAACRQEEDAMRSALAEQLRAKYNVRRQ